MPPDVQRARAVLSEMVEWGDIHFPTLSAHTLVQMLKLLSALWRREDDGDRTPFDILRWRRGYSSGDTVFCEGDYSFALSGPGASGNCVRVYSFAPNLPYLGTFSGEAGDLPFAPAKVFSEMVEKLLDKH